MHKYQVEISYKSGKMIIVPMKLYTDDLNDKENIRAINEEATFKAGVLSQDVMASWRIIGDAPKFDIHITSAKVTDTASELGQWFLVTIILAAIAMIIVFFFGPSTT